ncbi:TolC family protein [Legionella sp. km772]|uniref:TolC family protein n=1 Tax=Legionella sp. km772 TaxID=2498111 RepID=UPI000F8E4D88|nr:TolC family protein [Legionella sp. km772]RUR12935.1 TolC family protein [Legionella sp. km772]
MKFILNILTCICILLLSACTPKTTPPSKLRSLQINKGSTVNLAQVLWWKKIHDPVLNSLIAEALKNNNQILASQAKVLQAQAQLKASYNAWLPTVNASANGLLIKGWDTNLRPQGPLVTSPAVLAFNNIKINGEYSGFVPSYSLNLLENMNNNRLAKASLAMQQATHMALRLSIISQTTGAYFTLLGQKQQLREQENLIHDLKRLRHLEKVRYKDGASDYSALANIDQEIANNKASLSALQSSIRQVENSLQLLIDHAPGRITSQASLNKINIKNIIPSHIPAQVLVNRPDIIIAKENLISSDAHLGLAYAQFFPQISLTGLLGGSSVELVHLLRLTTGLGIVQIAAMMPIFNSALYQQIQAAKASVKAEYYNYIQTLRAALIDVDTSLTKHQKANEAYGHQLQAYKSAYRGYRILSARYRAGFQDRRAAMNAQIQVDQAKISLTQAKMEQLNTLVSAYQALAAGYLD